MNDQRYGPLVGVRVVEFAGIGPGPHCAMMLADFGAEVMRIDRVGGNGWPNAVVDRGRHVIELDLADVEERARARDAVAAADVLIEGYRPGVMERLGLGPEQVLRQNPRLIYARMTGWGQDGPLAQCAGHDINYIALTGALAAITGDEGRPIAPLNLVGDFGGGSLYLAFGIVAALLERERSGKGQVIDAAIVDGVASMMTMFAGMLPSGRISLDPTKNVLGGAAAHYRCYRCGDGKFISVGALEPKFYAELLERVGAEPEDPKDRNDPATWPARVKRFDDLFAQRTQAEWCEILEGTDACFAPVLTYEESLAHNHMQARSTYIHSAGVRQAAPAPRFSRTPGAINSSGDGEALLKKWLKYQ